MFLLSLLFNFFIIWNESHWKIMLKLLFFYIQKCSLDFCYLCFLTHFSNLSADLMETFIFYLSPRTLSHSMDITDFSIFPSNGSFIVLPVLITAYLTVNTKWVLTEWISTIVILKNKEKREINLTWGTILGFIKNTKALPLSSTYTVPSWGHRQAHTLNEVWYVVAYSVSQNC